jgi:hypothetical protein
LAFQGAAGYSGSLFFCDSSWSFEMRLLILAAGTALALSACKNNDQHDNTMNIDQNLTAENIVANDVTAIDAVTGDAANMAADVNYTDVNTGLDNETNAVAPSSTPRLKPNREAGPPAKPTTNTAASVTNNAAE